MSFSHADYVNCHFCKPLHIRWHLEDTGRAMEPKPYIPIIGRLTAWEFLGFIGAVIAALLGIVGVLVLSPMLKEISAPGSGGGAQMLLAMFVFPALFVSGSFILNGIVGFILLLWSANNRIKGRVPSPPSLDIIGVQTLARTMQLLTVTLTVQMLCIVFPLVIPWSFAFNTAVTFTGIAAGLVFLVCLGLLAARLRKNWGLWVFLTIVTPPFGPFVAYFLMRKAVADSLGASRISAR